MSTRQQFLRLAKRDTTLLFWANSGRYGFCLRPRIAREQDEHSTIFDARWLCFGMNVAFVDEDRVNRSPSFDAPKPKPPERASR
ncbi:MAG TPA: hypothetical protein VNW92_11565 [Polyangiaceae bacterium]|jgi:hypothetical protein|nr:hypothetical protein [Polyangiaceae bacterium]